MIHIIVTTYDAGMAANLGGAVESWSEIFEIDHPALEACIRAQSTYQSKVISVERSTGECENGGGK